MYNDFYYYGTNVTLNNLLVTMSTIRLIFYILIIATPLVFFVVCRYRIFEKCGEYGWKAVVPFLSGYTYIKLMTDNGFLFLVSLIPVMGTWVTSIICHVKMKDIFNLDSVELLILFMPFIGNAMIAYGNYEYDSDYAVM